MRSRLVESQKAYIARNRLTARAALKKTTPPAQNNRPTQSNVHQKQQSNVHQKQQSNDSGHSQSNETSSNHQQSLPSKPSEVSGMHSRFVAALALHEQNKLAQTQTSVDVPKKPQVKIKIFFANLEKKLTVFVCVLSNSRHRMHRATKHQLPRRTQIHKTQSKVHRYRYRMNQMKTTMQMVYGMTKWKTYNHRQ